MSKTATKDYSLVGENSRTALEKGLVDAAWYTSPVPKEEMRKLLKRKDGPAIANTLLWFGSLFGFGYWGYLWFPSLWCIIPFAVYGACIDITAPLLLQVELDLGAGRPPPGRDGLQSCQIVPHPKGGHYARLRPPPHRSGECG